MNSPSYRWLALSVVAGALALAVFARGPKTAPQPARPAATTAAESLQVEIAGGVVRPERTSVRKGSAVVFALQNRDNVPRRFALAGYEDRGISGTIRARGTVALRFLADRPGEDFAWVVDGRPAGRFAVTGSHLEEGHR